MLLATRLGRCIRFQITEETLRVFAGRDSSGVRGIKLQGATRADEVISLSVLRHMSRRRPRQRAAYLKLRRGAPARRRGRAGDRRPRPRSGAEEEPLSPERLAELEAAEEFLLTVTDQGFGKRRSAYEYRVTRPGRAGDRQHHPVAAHRHGGRRHACRCGRATTSCW